jgi:hypothetical protein
MSTEPTPAPTPPADPNPAFERSDVGCMIGLALILIVVPVTLYVAAPMAVLGIAAAGVAWGLMRCTPKVLREKVGIYKVFWFWFIMMVLLEVSVAVFIKYADSDRFRDTPIQRM